jgi:hypothetical protein
MHAHELPCVILSLVIRHPFCLIKLPWYNSLFTCLGFTCMRSIDTGSIYHSLYRDFVQISVVFDLVWQHYKIYSLSDKFQKTLTYQDRFIAVNY